MLGSFVLPIVYHWDSHDELQFMQAGVTEHFALSVSVWLNNHFTGRWIGRGGPIEYSVSNSDLIPCDDFPLWIWAKT
jgi:hypothetical protein